MIIIDRFNLEWDVPQDSMLQQKIRIFKEKCIWITVMIIREKLAAKRAIQLVRDNPDKFRIISPGGVNITLKDASPRMRCLKRGCGGYTTLEGKYRVCEVCRTEHQWNGKGWHAIKDEYTIPVQGIQINNKRIIRVRDKDIQAAFISKINERATFFKMKNVADKFDNNHGTKNSNNIYRDISISRLGLGFYGGAYRWLEYQLVNRKGSLPTVELVATHLAEVEPEIGDDTAQIQGNKLKISKYNFNMPSESDYLEIQGIITTSEILVSKTICARCQKDRDLNNEGYCNNCADKFDKKYLRDKMANAVARNKNTTKVVIKQNSLAYEKIIKEELNASQHQEK